VRRALRRALGPAAWLAVLTCAGAACAGSSVPAAVPPPTPASDTREVLRAAELRAHPDYPRRSLEELVRELRAGFLPRDGGPGAVLLDGRYAGPLTVLADIPASAVCEVRLVRGIAVRLAYGPQQRQAVVLDVRLRC
jgi:hypothetical protein